MTRATSLLWTLAALGAACGGEPAGEAPPPGPLVIESAHVPVLVSGDTVKVYAPTLFAYFASDLGQGDPSPMLLAAASAFQATLSDARPSLEALGVRVVPLDTVPVPLGIAPAADGAAGPRLAPGGFGFLLVVPQGRIRRLDRSATGADVACAAARLMEVAPPPQVGRSCR